MRSTRLSFAVLRTSAVAFACALLWAAPISAYTGRSVGTPEQIAWVRSAASRFLTAELAGDGASACAVLNAPLRASIHHRTCAQRWDAKLARMLRKGEIRKRLRSELRAVTAARVAVHDDVATIELPQPLMHGRSRFLWTENCWMLTR